MAFVLASMFRAWKTKSYLKPQLNSLIPKETSAMAQPSISEVDGIIVEVLDIHRNLELSKDDLEPCAHINALFGRLVGLSIKTIKETTTNEVLSDPRIIAILPSLHYLCGIAEGLLETYWARSISKLGNECLNAEAVQAQLRSFPYYFNYVDLTRMELSALNCLSPSSDPPLSKFAFIGSGPLPLTSLRICLSQPDVTVLNIDINENAIYDSQKLCTSLGSMTSGMQFLCSAANEPSLDFRDFDVVYLAALVGATQGAKENFLISVVGRMRVGALLVVRSAERLRRLMYAEFDPTSEVVLKCLDICLAVHPYNHVVNSVIIGKVKGGITDENCIDGQLRGT